MGYAVRARAANGRIRTMRTRKTALALLAVGLLLPALIRAQDSRLDGDFFTEDETQTDGNEVCTTVQGTEFGIGGRIVGQDGVCEVRLEYFTLLPNKVNASEAQGNGSGNAKISQSSHVFVRVTIEDNDAFCADFYTGSATPDKCNVSGSIKGTANSPEDDTVQSGKFTMQCDLGSEGAELGPTPNSTQFDTMVAAFENRADVKFGSSKKGSVKITQRGIPDQDPTVQCAPKVDLP
jgi:hypothetical protein